MTAIEKAFSYYGLKEFAGVKHNPVILDFFKAIGHKWVDDDETAWCAAFANYCCLSTIGKHTGKLNARSFLEFGVRTTTPKLGDLVVLWRVSPDSWKGHVGFYISESENHVYLLGGNQDNQVCIKPYPKERVLSYQIPR